MQEARLRSAGAVKQARGRQDQGSKGLIKRYLCVVIFAAVVEAHLDTNRVEGTGTKIKGSIKETIGNATGNPRLQAEGGADRAAGSAQAGVGRFLDAIRRIFTGRPTG